MHVTINSSAVGDAGSVDAPRGGGGWGGDLGSEGAREIRKISSLDPQPYK